MISPKELQYFTEVANCENLSRASERLGIAQPSLSSSIKKLEQAIGTNLFVRHKTGVKLTQAGKQLLSHAKEMQQFWNDVKSKAYNSHTQIRGSFRFGCHPSVGLYYIPEILAKLLVNNTDLELNIHYDLSRKITEAVINNTLDIGVVVNPIKHPDLVIVKLREDRVCIWHNLSSDELDKTEHTLICDPDLHQTMYIFNKMKGAKNILSFARIINSKNLEINAKLAQNKVGLAILPATVVRNLANNELQELPDTPVYHDEICIIFRPETKKIRAVEEIISSLKEGMIF